MMLNVKIKTPFKGCEDCIFFSPDRKAAMIPSLEGGTELTHAWECVNENRCKYIVRKAIGDDEFERLINEVAE